MSAEETAPEPQPPVVDVPRPDIAAPAPKKRGRKPLPRDANNNIIRDPVAVQQARLSGELKKRLPGGEILTDANVGKAIAGAFATLGIFRGPHWRLFPQEERELGECFGPLARMYGPEELARWITLLMCVPIVTGILAPRIAVERMVVTGKLEQQNGRAALLSLKAMVEAEKSLDIAKQVKESEALQRGMVTNGVEMQVENHNAQTKAEGIIQ